MSFQGLHHVCLKAKGREAFDRTVRFYTGTLGFSLLRTWGTGDRSGAMVDLGNCVLEIMATGQAGEEKGIFPHIALRTEDVDGALALAVSAGCPVVMEPTDKSLGEAYPMRIAFCTGPAGEEIEFFQER